MGEKILPKLIYAAVGVVGVLSLWGLVSTQSFGLTVPNASAYLLGIGGLAWGLLKFAKFDLVEKLNFF